MPILFISDLIEWLSITWLLANYGGLLLCLLAGSIAWRLAQLRPRRPEAFDMVRLVIASVVCLGVFSMGAWMVLEGG